MSKKDQFLDVKNKIAGWRNEVHAYQNTRKLKKIKIISKTLIAYN
jgi:hypothetical protein